MIYITSILRSSLIFFSPYLLPLYFNFPNQFEQRISIGFRNDLKALVDSGRNTGIWEPLKMPASTPPEITIRIDLSSESSKINPFSLSRRFSYLIQEESRLFETFSICTLYGYVYDRSNGILSIRFVFIGFLYVFFRKEVFMSKKGIIIAISAFVLILIVLGSAKVMQTKSLVKELFKLNKLRQEENYYMAEFEFKMLGILYYLDKGFYGRAVSLLDTLHHQLKTKENLIKIPEFRSNEEEYEFYLNLQNPRTGAFMDDAYPLSTYHGPTENVLLHLEALAEKIGQPLRLKYSLKYLDEINTPEKLIAFLNDVSTVGWLTSKFPQTSFHNARDILSLARDPNYYDENEVQMVIWKNDLYRFSSEWRNTLLRWMYEYQDPKTGLWGPKSKNGKLLKEDLNNTASIMKAFVDKNGNNIHPAFPLRYRNELFASVLKGLSVPIPPDDALDEWHEWHLKNLKGIRTLTRYLWTDASQENKEKAKAVIENFIGISFKKYFVPKDGSFSYYPGGKHATVDGMGGVSIFKEIGAFSGEKQRKLWGSPEENMTELGTGKISDLKQNNFDWIPQDREINSLRFYRKTPDYNRLTADVVAVVYPQKPQVLDIVDLTYKMKKWAYSTPLTMGNWVSKERILPLLESIENEGIPFFEGSIPNEWMNKTLQKNGELSAIGFDIMQLPKVKIVFR